VKIQQKRGFFCKVEEDLANGRGKILKFFQINNQDYETFAMVKIGSTDSTISTIPKVKQGEFLWQKPFGRSDNKG